MYVSAIVPAAGLGVRLNNPLPKPLVNLNKKPIFIHTLNVLSRHPDINEINLVVSSRSLKPTKYYLKKYKIKKISALVIGGPKRRNSVENALDKISSKTDIVLIHDAVRPFIDFDMLSRGIKAVKKSGAVVFGLPIKSTVKEVDTQAKVVRTLRMNSLYEIQTPQLFKRELIINAYKRFPNLAAVDDAFLVEELGKKVVVIPGSYFNIKITTPEDLVFAEAILRGKPR